MLWINGSLMETALMGIPPVIVWKNASDSVPNINMYMILCLVVCSKLRGLKMHEINTNICKTRSMYKLTLLFHTVLHNSFDTTWHAFGHNSKWSERRSSRKEHNLHNLSKSVMEVIINTTWLHTVHVTKIFY